MKKGRYYLSTLWDEKRKGFVSVITEGHPRRGDALTIVCTVGVFPTQKEAKAWFRRQVAERPWEDEIDALHSTHEAPLRLN